MLISYGILYLHPPTRSQNTSFQKCVILFRLLIYFYPLCYLLQIFTYLNWQTVCDWQLHSSADKILALQKRKCPVETTNKLSVRKYRFEMQLFCFLSQVPGLLTRKIPGPSTCCREQHYRRKLRHSILLMVPDWDSQVSWHGKPHIFIWPRATKHPHNLTERWQHRQLQKWWKCFT